MKAATVDKSFGEILPFHRSRERGQSLGCGIKEHFPRKLWATIKHVGVWWQYSRREEEWMLWNREGVTGTKIFKKERRKGTQRKGGAGHKWSRKHLIRKTGEMGSQRHLPAGFAQKSPYQGDLPWPPFLKWHLGTVLYFFIEYVHYAHQNNVLDEL